MDASIVGLLSLAALLTSVLSAVVGMAGGITLLSVMLLFMDPLLAIPLHGVAQLVSNSSRTLIQRRHVEWSILWRYAIPLLPLGFLGLRIAESLPPQGLKALIGVFVLLATWAPAALVLGAHPERALPGRRFLLMGVVVGLLNTTVGATGPLIAPFFLNLGLSRQGIIGSKAACQTAGHLAKLVIFGVAGFAFGEHLPLLAALCASVIVGTWLGSQLLERVDEVWFRRLYRGVLTAIALRLAIWDGLGAAGLL